ncbi:hypothetical protein D2Q93_14440 [Alicyclobacillaceae bacterium I2511]|nr:hypothetical protein D2Q93_14440 [Alicyclobacillaceae bacterium I2511]
MYLAELAEQGRKTQSLPNTRMRLRDRALLLLGFSGAFRRTELVALDRSDLEFLQEGLKVTIRRSKGEQKSWQFCQLRSIFVCNLASIALLRRSRFLMNEFI